MECTAPTIIGRYNETMRAVVGCACAILFCSAILSALDPTVPITSYGHKAWQSEDGLPQNSVLALTQTRDGYLWMGTQGGLVRFDGAGFTVFDTQNSVLGNNDVTGLVEDAAGRLWVATYSSGLSVYDHGRLIRYEQNASLSDPTVRILFLDNKAGIWAGTRNGGINHLQSGKIVHQNAASGLAGDSVQAIATDDAGNLWVGTGTGLSLFRNGKIENFTTRNGLPNDSIRCLLFDREGSLWIGTENGLAVRKGSSFITLTEKQGLANNYVRAILQDRDGNIWFGTDGGLTRYAGGILQSAAQGFLTHNSVTALYEDREGTLWVGTDGGGLNQLRNVSFTNYESTASRDFTVFSVYQDPDGSLWAGTRNNGLLHYTANGIETYTTENGLTANTVFALLRDRNATLWIGTRGNGINLLRNNQIEPFRGNENLSKATIRALVEDHEGNIWIGTSNGLYRYHSGNLTAFTKKDGLSHNFIYSILEDRHGQVWFGTWSGVTRYSDGNFTALNSRNGFTDANVWCIHEDSKGALWFGTYGSGIFRLQEGHVSVFNRRDGLPEETLLGLVEDNMGNLWMSSYHGIFRASILDMEALAAGKRKNIWWESFDSSDGMRSTECIGGVQPSAWKARDGRLFFPTGKGLTTIDPSRIQRNLVPPPIQIEKLTYDRSLFLDVAQQPQKFRLPPGDGNLEIQYTALSFVEPRKNRFQYKLDGLDNYWVDASTRRVAFYTKLPPGDYTFHVRGSNNNGVWNEKGASFRFTIRPHFYQTSWFYALCLVALIGSVLGIHRVRVRQIQARFAAVLDERNRISREIHDTLTQDFTGVVLQLEAAELSLPEQAEEIRDCIDRARDLARTGLVESRRFVKGLRAAELQRHDLEAGLMQIALRTERDSGIHTQMEVSGKKRVLPAEIEENILRIAREAVTNSVKHANSKNIHLRLDYKRRQLELEVSDNGCGFNPALIPGSSREGFGLTSMKERAALIRARLWIDSSPGAGTKVILNAPVEKESLWAKKNL